MAKKTVTVSVDSVFEDFSSATNPLEAESLHLLVDDRTGAHYCECHIKGSVLIELGTVDVPLDPDEQAEYRANRQIVENHSAFLKMKEDALGGRTFSNIVAEFTKDFEPDSPIKIIGGQHRFQAIKEALESKVDKYHGLKVYFMLTTEQRLDVQLISNTNIAVSADLFDRMQETVRGPELRDWCQEVGLLDDGEDFADKKERGGPVSVQLARTFIVNYFRGKEVAAKDFERTETTPIVCATGQADDKWDELLRTHKTLWKDQKLRDAGREFASLVAAQRAAHATNRQRDFPEKAMNAAILSAWAYVAGMLHTNDTRLKRHIALKSAPGKDPLNAAALAKGRHRTDQENYRGLGYRTDAKERGRFVELFYYQAEKGGGITKAAIEVAIAKYHAKLAALEVSKLQGHE